MGGWSDALDLEPPGEPFKASKLDWFYVGNMVNFGFFRSFLSAFLSFLKPSIFTITVKLVFNIKILLLNVLVLIRLFSKSISKIYEVIFRQKMPIFREFIRLSSSLLYKINLSNASSSS